MTDALMLFLQVKRLSGVVNDCCCEYETVDRLNLEVLQPLLKELVAKPFFRYFKVSLRLTAPQRQLTGTAPPPWDGAGRFQVVSAKRFETKSKPVSG